MSEGFEAIHEMRRLRRVHELSFTFNPGGGEFYRDGWRCQISCWNDDDDLVRLREALRRPRERRGSTAGGNG